MRRVVLDTNVIVSAVIGGGKPGDLLALGLEGRFRIVTSRFILEELAQVLNQPRFKASKDGIRRLILALTRSSEVVNLVSDLHVVKEDPADNAILNTAYDGGADAIVTGDKLLLRLGNFRKTKILSVSAALKELCVVHVCS